MVHFKRRAVDESLSELVAFELKPVQISTELAPKLVMSPYTLA